eukprot:966803-Prorocentrum_lima.AAC.1
MSNSQQWDYQQPGLQSLPPLQPSHTYHGQHVIDFCTRYTQAKIVTSRTAQSLRRGLQELWMRPF